MKIVLRILNISSTWILPNHHHLHLWNCSYFSISDIKVDFYGYWKMVNIWVEHVFISSVHQNFYHIYILHRASISVSFFASPVSENILSYVFFFSMPVSILWFVLINHIFLQVHWFVSNVFFFLSGNVSLWVLSIQQCQANLQYCHTVPKGIMPSYHNYNKPKHSARVITNYLQQEATYNCFASTCSWS